MNTEVEVNLYFNNRKLFSHYSSYSHLDFFCVKVLDADAIYEKPFKKPPIVPGQAHKVSDVGRTQRSRPSFYHIHLSRINLYTFTTDNVSKKRN